MMSCCVVACTNCHLKMHLTDSKTVVIGNNGKLPFKGRTLMDQPGNLATGDQIFSLHFVSGEKNENPTNPGTFLCWTVVSSCGMQTSPIRRSHTSWQHLRPTKLFLLSILILVLTASPSGSLQPSWLYSAGIAVSNGRSIMRECCTKPHTYTILGPDILHSCSQTLLMNPSVKIW